MADGNGRKILLHFYHPPRRVVSLVPSMTESMFDLGFGEALVGITDFCTQPREAVSSLPRLGGPKNPRVEEIIALLPDLVLANMEENTQQAVEALEDAGIAVWVTFPKTVRAALDVLWKLVELFNSRSAAARLETLELTLEWAQDAAGEGERVRYFCPIWFDHTDDSTPWWMTFNQQTYASDLLAILGGQNVFAERQRRYPLGADLRREEPQEAGDRDRRYPRISLEELRSADPQMILLPNEPYAFDEKHRQELESLLAGCQAVQNQRIYPVDGSLITWHGTRLALALRELQGLFAAV